MMFVFVVLFSSVFCSKKSNEEKKMKFTGRDGEVKLMTLDPGHFHAALVQKFMNKQVLPEVYVFAPEGPDVQDHLQRIAGFNSRAENPTHWQEIVYTGDDYLAKMIRDKPGNVVVISGNNRKKTEYIKDAVAAGINVLADKPMAIDTKGFHLLEKAFSLAAQKGVLLYDIMTERSEITTILQRELSQIPELFGELQKGSPDDPAVTKESVHHFYKYVAGKVLKRPPWYFDVQQQGEGIVDVTTHLIDLVQWECFPQQKLDYHHDIRINSAKRWPTEITPEQFKSVTRLANYPDYLNKYIVDDSLLNVYANGEIVYKIKGVWAKVSVRWNYRAPEGGGDTHFSIMRGSKASLIIRQGKEQNYRPELYVEPAAGLDRAAFADALQDAVKKINRRYPEIKLKKSAGTWHVIIPAKYRLGHEAHFGQVLTRYLNYLVQGRLPDWEIPNMLAKYYTTTTALQIAKNQQ